jgi:glycogen operon protein
VTAHDGFTLHDLVSYNHKHNEANGEENRDGEDHNRSWNCGTEGETDDQEVTELRSKQKRNFLTTLMLSQGVPMIVAGDELGRTQKGNNNAYCQDNEISWINWEHADTGLLAFTQKLIHFRKKHPNFRRRLWFRGVPIKGEGIEDIAWFLPEGNEMPEENWSHDFAKSLGIFLNGEGIRTVGPKGERTVDNSFYVMFNGHYEDLNFILPKRKYGSKWMKVIDTHENLLTESGEIFKPGDTLTVHSRSVVLLMNPTIRKSHDNKYKQEEYRNKFQGVRRS